MKSETLKTVLSRIDRFNEDDPQKESVTYSKNLTQWVITLSPQASDELRVAARGQHIGRWTIPRGQYPEGRGGYLRWREDLKKFHAETVARLMEESGAEPASIARVRDIILKKNLKSDPDVQTIEDALCLLFLETQLAELKDRTPHDKMVDIIKKTWGKMSAQGRDLALNLKLPPDLKEFLMKALSACLILLAMSACKPKNPQEVDNAATRYVDNLQSDVGKARVNVDKMNQATAETSSQINQAVGQGE